MSTVFLFIQNWNVFSIRWLLLVPASATVCPAVKIDHCSLRVYLVVLDGDIWGKSDISAFREFTF